MSEHQEEETFDPAPHRPTRRGFTIAVSVTVGVFTLLTLLGIVPRLVQGARDRAERLDAESVPAHVTVSRAVHAGHGSGLSLPGSIQPVQETIVYARTNGYVKKYLVDIGDKVTTGQILAELDTPDVDQELRQSESMMEQSQAMLEQARTQFDLTRVTANRYNALGPSGVVSQQELEERQTAMQAGQANLNAAQGALGSAEANVRRLQELKTFATIRSPFAGAVTSRSVENGQLVVAGTANGQPMFTVSRTDVVRVFINVPQQYSPDVRVDAAAATTVREYGARVFPGVITRTASVLDPASRTLLTEVRIPNPTGVLFAGMYAQVQLDVQRQTESLWVPATALMTTAEGTHVAVVKDGTIHWRAVTIDTDMGDRVAVTSALQEGDTIVNMPSYSLTEGMLVIVDEAKKS